MLLPNGLLEIGGLRTILLKIERAHQYGGLQAFAAAKGELSYVARSITFRKTAREVSAINSTAYLRKRSASPAAHRTSMSTLRPTTQPASCRPCRKTPMRRCPSASSAARCMSTPIRRMRSGRCARAASGHATVAPPSSVMKLRRPITRSPRRRSSACTPSRLHEQNYPLAARGIRQRIPQTANRAQPKHPSTTWRGITSFNGESPARRVPYSTRPSATLRTRSTTSPFFIDSAGRGDRHLG